MTATLALILFTVGWWAGRRWERATRIIDNAPGAQR